MACSDFSSSSADEFRVQDHFDRICAGTGRANVEEGTCWIDSCFVRISVVGLPLTRKSVCMAPKVFFVSLLNIPRGT